MPKRREGQRLMVGDVIVCAHRGHAPTRRVVVAIVDGMAVTDDDMRFMRTVRRAGEVRTQSMRALVFPYVRYWAHREDEDELLRSV